MKEKKIKKKLSFKKLLNGFTLIEILLVFAVIGIITTITVTSFGTYSASQTFGTGVSEFANFMSITRSKSISQVKPSVCSSATLEGYMVALTSSTDYVQDVICGGNIYQISKKKLPGQVTFLTGSASSITFDVSTGTVKNTGSIAIGGFGRTNTIKIDKIGNISIVNGLNLDPIADNSITPGISQGPTPGCLKSYVFVGPSTCQYLGSGTNYGEYCEATCGGLVGAQPAFSPTPTITPSPTVPPASTSVVVSAPATSTYDTYVIFNVTVTGVNCTPLGQLILYRDTPAQVFTAVSLSGTNPKSGSASYRGLTVGAHTIFARYTSASSTTYCPNADSAVISHTVN